MSRERKAFNSDRSSSSGSKKTYTSSKDKFANPRDKSGKSRTEKSDKPFRPSDKKKSDKGDERPAMFTKRVEKTDKPFRSKDREDSGKSGETLKRVQRDSKDDKTKPFKSRTGKSTDKPYESRAQKEYGDSKEARPSKFKSKDSGKSSETPKRVQRDFKDDKSKPYTSRTGRTIDSAKSKSTGTESAFKKRLIETGEYDELNKSVERESKSNIETPKRAHGDFDTTKHNAKYKDKKPFGPKKSKGDPLPSFSTDIRLNKYISNAGICSRREADVMIASGIVQVNGKIILELGYKVKPDDVVKYDGATIRSEKKQYVLLNKPKDFITTMDDPQNRKTVMQLVVKACRERIYPVGRLDRNTTGLLLFTNDGDLAKKLTHPRYEIKKLYHVETTEQVTKQQIEALLSGVELDDGGFVKADKVEIIKDSKFREVGIEIHSGKYRVVRRMFESLGHVVKKLDRVSFAGLTKKDLPRGTYRHLSEQEVNFLRML